MAARCKQGVGQECIAATRQATQEELDEDFIGGSRDIWARGERLSYCQNKKGKYARPHYPHSK
jgi:hypothetical protein